MLNHMLLTMHFKTFQDEDKKVGVELALQDVERKKFLKRIENVSAKLAKAAL